MLRNEATFNGLVPANIKTELRRGSKYRTKSMNVFFIFFFMVPRILMVFYVTYPWMTWAIMTRYDFISFVVVKIVCPLTIQPNLCSAIHLYKNVS